MVNRKKCEILFIWLTVSGRRFRSSHMSAGFGRFGHPGPTSNSLPHLVFGRRFRSSHMSPQCPSSHSLPHLGDLGFLSLPLPSHFSPTSLPIPSHFPDHSHVPEPHTFHISPISLPLPSHFLPTSQTTTTFRNPTLFTSPLVPYHFSPPLSPTPPLILLPLPPVPNHCLPLLPTPLRVTLINIIYC